MAAFSHDKKKDNEVINWVTMSPLLVPQSLLFIPSDLKLDGSKMISTI